VSDLRIRRASAADLPAINALGKELMVPHAQHYPAMFRSDGLEPYWRECLDKPDHAVFPAISLYEGLGYGIRTHMIKLIGRKD
jgi:hypothetical protein